MTTPIKPDFQNLRIVELPMKERPKSAPQKPDYGALFLNEIERIADEYGEKGLSKQDMKIILQGFYSVLN